MPERVIDYGTWSQQIATWEEFVTVLDALSAANPSVRMLFADKDSRTENELIVEFGSNLGFNLSLLQENCTLIAPSLGNEMVPCDNYGERCQSPRCCFVERSLMLLAARHFFETGDKAPTLDWMDTGASFAPLGI